MMRVISLMLVCVVTLIAGTRPLQAGPITLSTSDSQFDPGVDNQGWWSNTSAGADDNDNYVTGQLSATAIFRSFFTFDLSSLGPLDVITSATLRLHRYDSAFGNEATETLGFFDVSTDAATLNNNVGTNAAIYNDLGTGTSYGTFVVDGSGSSTDVLSFTLNAAAIADLNAAKGGFFSIGGDLVTLNGVDYLFGGSGGDGGQDLALDVESPSAVPEPTSIGLLGLGIFFWLAPAFARNAAARCRRRNRQS